MSMKKYEFWFVVGSQSLCGQEVLETVEARARKMAAEMNAIASSSIGGTMLIGTFFGVLSLATIKNIVSSLGLDEAWWTNITVAAMLCLILVIQSVVLLRKNKSKH